MTFFNDTYCQLCERFIPKEQWNNNLHSNRQIHREVNGYWPAFFPRRKLSGDADSILEKAFSKIFLKLEMLKKWKIFS